MPPPAFAGGATQKLAELSTTTRELSGEHHANAGELNQIYQAGKTTREHPSANINTRGEHRAQEGDGGTGPASRVSHEKQHGTLGR